MSGWTAFAPAKVNLFLHVGPVEPDGYHPLVSAAVFADVGDDLRTREAEAFSLTVKGREAEALAGENLIERAVDAWAGGGRRPALAITLNKALPIAAGLGGGTADGCAALRLFAALDGEAGGERMSRAAAALGADGAACLASAPVLMEGRGERLRPLRLPELYGVLVNPGLPCPTGAVYGAFDRRGAAGSIEAAPPEGGCAAELIAWLHEESRNDLGPAALEVQPAIAGVLARLQALPQARLVRMSGSGATCFALTENFEAAQVAAARLAAETPGWWVRACRLGDQRRRAAPRPSGT